MSRSTEAGCPSEDVIAAFVADDLDDEERDSLHRHMDACPACGAVVAEMVRVFAGSRLATAPPADSVTPQGDPPADQQPLPAGAVIGRYRVLEVVGMGGMGVVYAAHDPQLERRVALKLLRSRSSVDADPESARLLREARAMARLSHPNVIAVHDVGTWNGRVFVAMEFVDGWTLKGWLREHERSWASVWPVLQAAGRGLAAAHAAGFVHRDFKPDNVLVSRAGRVFVTDFGLARWGEAATVESEATAEDSRGLAANTQPVDSRTEPETRAALTRSGAFVGTPAYMAPEQFARERVGAACDQFAYCVVVWEALVGERPFKGRTLAALSHEVREAELPAMPPLPTVPRRVRAALVRGLAKRPTERFASMTALLHALAPRRRGWLPWVAAGGAALLAAPLLVYATRTPGAAPCSGLQGLSETWNDEREAELTVAFAASGARIASEAGRNVSERLDAYATQWATAELEVCTATQDGALDPGRAALRRRCLDRGHVLFAGVVAGLATADTRTVARSVGVVSALPPVERCGDDERLSADLPPAPPAEIADEVESIRDVLLAADADVRLGRYDAGLSLVAPVVERAEALAFRPLIADVAYARGRLLANVGQAKEAVLELERAELEGTASRHVVAVAKALILNLYAMALRGDDWPAIQAAAKRAGAAADAASLDPSTRSTLHTNVAVGAYYNNELEEAEAASARALALLDRASDPLKWAATSLNLAGYQRRRGAEDKALPTIRVVIEIYERELGRVHPDVAEAYRVLAISLKNLERFDDAREAARTALQLNAESMGETSHVYGGTLSTLSGIEGEAQRFDDALELARRSSQVLAAAKQATQIPDAQQAQWLIALGRPDEAVPLVDGLLTKEIERRGPQSPSLSWIYFVRASLEAARKDVDATRTACDRAIELSGVDPSSEDGLSLEIDRAVHLADAGGGAEALRLLERVLPRVEATAASPTTARIFRELALTSWSLPGRRTQARAWMQRAHAQFVALKMDDSAGQVQAWLHEHAP